MTTAARPTFEPAKGGMGRGERDLSALSKQYASRDLPSHTRLKYREHGQGTADENRGRDFKRELEDKEKSSTKRSSRQQSRSEPKKPRLDSITPDNLDADDPQDDNSDSDDDSDDEQLNLQAELHRVRRERVEENARLQKERSEQEERIRMENIISGNPLFNLTPAVQAKTDQKVKRRWDDDVVFKNCAAGEGKTPENAFINDSLRSEFHKRFMSKYIK